MSTTTAATDTLDLEALLKVELEGELFRLRWPSDAEILQRLMDSATDADIQFVQSLLREPRDVSPAQAKTIQEVFCKPRVIAVKPVGGSTVQITLKFGDRQAAHWLRLPKIGRDSFIYRNLEKIGIRKPTEAQVLYHLEHANPVTQAAHYEILYRKVDGYPGGRIPVSHKIKAVWAAVTEFIDDRKVA